MRFSSLLFILIGITLLGANPAASAQKRIALIIGNSAYAFAPLANPVNDAADIAAKLSAQGFEVASLLDAGQRDMEQAIHEFIQKLTGQDAVGLFYFAGHGIEVGGNNYLLPVDAKIRSETDVKYESVNAGRVLDGMDRAGNGLNLLVLDACRNNPFARSSRSTAQGLEKMNPASGTLILYATEPRKTAQDGAGRNGTFTKHLLASIGQPGLKVEEVFKRTALQVNKETGGEQIPWVEGVILGEFYFLPPDSTRPPASSAQDSAVQAENEIELAFWRSVDRDPSPQSYKTYLEEYPHGRFSRLARIRLARLMPPSQSGHNRLTIITNPPGATVRILNIGPKYKDGIELEPGRYHVEVTKEGYEPYREWRELNKPTYILPVALKPLPGHVAESASTIATESAIHFDGEPQMLPIKAGCYQMGSPADEPYRDQDEDRHQVCVEDFWMGKFEVTFDQYDKFAEATARIKPDDNGWGRGNLPVTNVDWEDATAYARWLSKKTGKKYRLATEAEWEFAARAGSLTAFWYGDHEDSNAGNFGRELCCDGRVAGEDQWKYSAPVGSFKPNAWGLHDMAGNVYEWVCSDYEKQYQGQELICAGPSAGNLRILRGGSWYNQPRWTRSANRYAVEPDQSDNDWGFRVVREAGE